jgi:GT2 family glycosyltransferase/glycosyltransferase involved in cell wall biosynthesis
LSPASSTDGFRTPLFCFHADVPDATRVATAIARLPTGAERAWICAPGMHPPPGETLLAHASGNDEILRALATHAAGRDVVLLAPDAELPSRWWPRLQAAVSATPQAAVFSPLSQAHADTDPFAADAEPDIEARDARCWSESDRSVLPCTHRCAALSYWRAEALSTAACADSERGETTALPAGCSGVLLDHLYVGAVARAPRDVAMPPAVAALAARLQAARSAALPHFGLDGRGVVLHVLHGWGGGAQRFVEDLAAGDRERHHLVLLARSDPQRRIHGVALALHASLSQPALQQWPLSAPIAVTALQSPEYRAILARVLRDYGVGAVLVSSLIGHSLDALRSGLPTAVVCHDYHPLWPRLHADFGDAQRDFTSAAIASALAATGADYEFAERRADAWQALRRGYVEALQQAAATLIAPSAGVMSNLQRIEPALAALAWRRIEHGFAPWPAPPAPVAPDPARRVLRIVVPGRIHGGKGEVLLDALIPKLPADVELVLLGGGAAAMRYFGRGGVHVRLDYARAQLPALLAQLAPDAALLPSTVAETYSYLLSELWTLRLPVIATRLGSYAERIVPERDGLLVEPDAAAVAALLAELRDRREPLQRLRAAAAPALPTLEQMAQRYRDALPLAAPSAIAAPPLALDARSAALERDAAQRAIELRALQAQVREQQQELVRRADWAHAEARLAQERLQHANRAQAESNELRGRRDELEHEVGALHAWANSLLAEGERLKELVVSEQQRLEREIERERDVVREVQREMSEREMELHRILTSHSWRLTRPMRWLRRKLVALPTRLRYQLVRAASLRHRVQRSLRARGVAGTLARVRQELRGTQPQSTLVLPEARDTTLPQLSLPEQPRASVIVPVYNQFHHTRTCLRALASCGDAAAFEVIVVDDGSSDETREQLEPLAGLRYHRNAQNLGFIGACNAGAAIARGEYLVFLNNDTAVQPGWLDALLATFAQQRDVGLAGAKLVYPDGRLQEAGGIVFRDGSGWNYGRFEDPADPRYNYVRDVDYCSGAAIALPRALFERFGGFDPLYTPAYYEDTDLAFKVRAAGLRVLYQPASVVVHFEGVTSGTDTAGTGVKRYQVVNQQKFLDRWRDALGAHPAPGTAIPIAREHRANKRVLIIDATTPQPDHDSGSLRLVNAMRVLREEGHAITFFADNRAWVDGYTAQLQQLGVEVLWHPWLADPVRWFAENGRRFDLVLVSRHYIASSYVGLVRLHAPQARLVFDTVDLHYLREQREAELAGREDLARAAETTRSKELALIRSSDITLVVSPVEQELLRREVPGARIEVLSNVHEVFGRRREFGARRDLMFMGGYQHTPNVDAVEWFVREVFPRVRHELPEVRFHLIGSRATDAVRALAEVEGVVFEGFVPDVEPFLDGCRLAVAPLRYGAGVKGKVNMSMSYGQPVIATPIAIEGMHAEAGRDVLVAETAQAFAAEVVRAYRDERLWTSLSDHAIENVRRHFSFESARAAVRSLFQ